MPTQDRPISCFLECLRDSNLHLQLFGQKHTKLEECFTDALLYKDNCTMGGVNVREETKGSSHTSQHVNSEAIADIVLCKMRQEGRGNIVPRGITYPQAYICGIFLGNHPTGACQNEANGVMWCEICKKYCTHTAETYFKRARGPNPQYQNKQDTIREGTKIKEPIRTKGTKIKDILTRETLR